NANYEVLGLVVETVSGQSYERYLAEHVLAPLDMADSSAGPDGPVAAGHHSWFGFPQRTDLPYLRSAVPAGFVTTTATDLARYLIAQLNDGQLWGRAIVSPAGLGELQRPAVDTRQPFYGEPQAYAQGWSVGRVAGADAVWHHGHAFASSSPLALLPGSHAA